MLNELTHMRAGVYQFAEEYAQEEDSDNLLQIGVLKKAWPCHWSKKLECYRQNRVYALEDGGFLSVFAMFNPKGDIVTISVMSCDEFGKATEEGIQFVAEGANVADTLSRFNVVAEPPSLVMNKFTNSSHENGKEENEYVVSPAFGGADPADRLIITTQVAKQGGTVKIAQVMRGDDVVMEWIDLGWATDEEMLFAAGIQLDDLESSAMQWFVTPRQLLDEAMDACGDFDEPLLCEGEWDVPLDVRWEHTSLYAQTSGWMYVPVRDAENLLVFRAIQKVEVPIFQRFVTAS